MGLFLIGVGPESGRSPILKSKIVIAGGGVLGLSVALHCARKAGSDSSAVVLLDRGHLGAGSSLRSGAVIRQYDSNRVLAGMKRDSLKYYQALIRNTGRSVGFQASGVLTVAGPSQPELAAEIEEAIEMQRAIGIDVRRVGKEEISLLVPGAKVAEGSVGAYEPDAGIVDPMRTLECFATLARTSGATVRMGGSEVTDLIIESGRVVGVKTPRGDIRSERVVLSAGPWARAFLARYDVDLPIQIRRPSYLFVSMLGSDTEELLEGQDLFSTAYMKKGELGLLSVKEDRDLDEEVEMRFGGGEGEDAPAPHPVLPDLENDFYAKPEPASGRTRISRLDSESHPIVESPDNYDDVVDDKFPHWARAALEKRIPSYANEESLGSDCNLVCQTPDGQGLLGPVESLPGLFLITGFLGSDFTLAPSIGEGVAQMLFDEPVSAFDPELFAVGRF